VVELSKQNLNEFQLNTLWGKVEQLSDAQKILLVDEVEELVTTGNLTSTQKSNLESIIERWRNQ
jgi:hypothetical protein